MRGITVIQASFDLSLILGVVRVPEMKKEGRDFVLLRLGQ